MKQKLRITIRKILNSLFGGELNEGVSYNEISDDFTFNFENDGKIDIIKLNKLELEKVNFYGDVHYFGYEFEDNVSSNIRKKFIKAIKFNQVVQQSKDFKRMLFNAVVKLNKEISLINYNTFVYPESQSNLNREMMSEVSKLTYTKNYISFELIKELPKNITFDFEGFKERELNKVNENGNPVYPEHSKKEIIKNIQDLLFKIKDSDYFSIARSVKNNKYKLFFQNFLKFKREEEAVKYKAITNTNILIFDDITTTGSTLFEIMRVLRSINPNNKIVLFTLIGKKSDL